MSSNATEDPLPIRDCYYTMSCTLTDLWLASVAYQKERSLRLARNRQSSQETAKTTLATLPNELFEHILTFVREAAHTDYFDTFPYVQICECVNIEKAWTKQIVMEAFNEWGKTNFKRMAANPPGQLLTKADPRWLDHHEEYENTEEFSQLLSFAAYGMFAECNKCIRKFERFWRAIGGRKEPGTEMNIKAVGIVNSFINDHHLKAIEVECWDDNYTDGGDEETDSAEYLTAYIGPSQHLYHKTSLYAAQHPAPSATDIPFSAGLLSLAKTHRLTNLRWSRLCIAEVLEEDEEEGEEDTNSGSEVAGGEVTIDAATSNLNAQASAGVLGD